MMKRRKVMAFLMSLFMLFSLLIPQQSALAAESGIEVQFNNGNTATNSNTINAKFKVVNTGGSSVNLSQLKLRYYYTKDADKAQNFYCDYAGMLNGGAHTNMTNKITGTIVNMSKSTATADTYIEIGFTSDAGSLASGGNIEIQTRVSRNDWTNYDQSNDFSYKSAGSYTVWDQVAAYLNGTRVFGNSPDEETTKDPEISPKSATFNKSVPKNITITLTPNGNTFQGISGLTKNTHYSVSGNTVTLLSSYLSTLSLGSKTLTFDFGVANNPKLNLTITEDVTDALEVSIGTVTGKKGDTVTVPVSFANVSKMGNVGTCNFYIDYDSNLLDVESVSAGSIVTNPSVNFSTSTAKKGTISFLFLDDTITDQPITKDGVFANLNFKIKGDPGNTAPVTFQGIGAFGNGKMQKITAVNFADGSVIIKDDIVTDDLLVTLGSKTANQGETVTIPVTLENVADVGNIAASNMYINYDASLLEAVSVTAGNIIVNKNNLQSSIEPGSIGIGFLDNTLGNELITKDGVFANITFKLKGAPGKTADVKFTSETSFGDSRLNKILNVSYTNGSVTIKKGTETGFSVEIGTVNGPKGKEVTVPITFADVAKAGNVGTCNFYVSYDSALLEAVSVSAGDIVTNPSINFASKILTNSSTISFLFTDDTLGDEPITKDGVFANITFKVVGNTGKTASVKFQEGGAFGNGDYQKIYGVNMIDGGVIITSIEDPTISPTSGVFDKYAPKDIVVTLTPKESTFKGITGLKKGTDYTVSGNTVTILASYLSSLNLGPASLVFDFSVANNPVLSLEIKDSTPPADKLAVSVGTISAQTGKEVTVPITFTNVAKAGNVGTCNFYLSYDSSLLEAVSVSAGDIVTNPPVNFASKILANSSTISFLFTDDTLGDEPITKDGVFANITFKVVGDTGTASVKFQEGGAFGNGDLQKIYDVNMTNGGVIIASTEDPTISPISQVFDKYAPEEIIIILTPNGNTFAGITGLNEGTDYIVSNNTVAILASYLSSLDVGQTTLTFDFGVANNPVLSLDIKDSTPTTDSLTVSVGSVSGKTGETVTVPISIANVEKAGNIGAYSFAVTYDSTILKPVGITDGELLADKGLAKASAVSGSAIAIDGEALEDFATERAGFRALAPKYERPIYLSFNAFKSQEITEDGILAYIEFEILGDAGSIAAVNVRRDGVFENSDREVITSVQYTDGKVVVLGDGPLNPSITPVTAIFDKYTPSDITVFMTPNENTFNGITGLLEGRDYSVSNNTVTIFSSYLSSLELGSATLTFDFGVSENPTIEIAIEDTTPVETEVNLSIGKVSGKTGDTITVPVKLGNIAKVNNILSGNFYISYDSNLLQAVSVSAGDIITNAPVNFSSYIRAGKISCLYLDNTIGEELITKDGVMLTITFKILGTESVETPVVFEADGAFSDGNLNPIPMKKLNGSVKIN